MLQVQWDEFASFPRPNQISPWDIEHLTPWSNVSRSSFLKNKRSREVNEIGIKRDTYNLLFNEFKIL